MNVGEPTKEDYKIYYEILKDKKGNYVVMKTVENHGVAFKGVYRGLRKECIRYCEDNNIKPINIK